MNFEVIEDLCKNKLGTIEYHIEKPTIAQGFQYEMEEEYDNEIEIRFPSSTNNILDFLDDLNKNYKNDTSCDWIEHYGEELMKEYDVIHIWWKNETDN